MKLKKALCGIKPTQEQKDKIYGDILEKLSEGPPETERNNNMKKKNIAAVIAASIAAVIAVGGTVYAVSPEIRDGVRRIVFMYSIPTEVPEAFPKLEEIGRLLPKGEITFADSSDDEYTDFIAINAEKTAEGEYSLGNIAYRANTNIVLCDENGNGFYFDEGEGCDIEINADLTSLDCNNESGERITAGYIYEGTAYEIYRGKTSPYGITIPFTAEKAGEYRFYIWNTSVNYQLYNRVYIGNRRSVESYYEMFDGGSDIENLGNSLSIPENEDFSPFADGIGAKLAGVINSGKFAELIVGFSFDREIADAEYLISGAEIKNLSSETHLLSYSWGYLSVNERGEIFGHFIIENTENIPSDCPFRLEITGLERPKSKRVSDGRDEITGHFETDFTLGEKPEYTVLETEPAEIFWHQPKMGDATAHMELTGLRYSPKYIEADLRMLEDCAVEYEWDTGFEKGGASYFNSTSMFFMISRGGEYDPINFRMKDGSIRGSHCTHAQSDWSWMDKHTLGEGGDPRRISQDISSDEPTAVLFEFYDIMDYSDVEAIIFCGKEFLLD